MSPEILSLWPVKRSKKLGDNSPTQRYLNPLPLVIPSPLLILPIDGTGFTWWLVLHICNTSYLSAVPLQKHTPRGRHIEQRCGSSLDFSSLKQLCKILKRPSLPSPIPSWKPRSQRSELLTQDSAMALPQSAWVCWFTPDKGLARYTVNLVFKMLIASATFSLWLIPLHLLFAVIACTAFAYGISRREII